MESQVGPTTPVELVESLYRRYPERVAVARRRLGRPLTFTDKVLIAHADDPETVGLDRDARDPPPCGAAALRVAVADTGEPARPSQRLRIEPGDERGAPVVADRPAGAGAGRRLSAARHGPGR